MTHSSLPDAVCIGSSKCGTTSLHYYLHSHPEIGVPRSKEVHFFLDPGNWHRGEAWYRRQFPDRRVRVESFGGGYSHYPVQQGVAQRMHQVLPHGKFIYMVRDPIERMISRYMHNVAECLDFDPPEIAFSGDPATNRYISESLYFMQLEQYLPFFDRDRFLVIDDRAFREQRKETLRTVFRFLGVDEAFTSPAFDVIRHPTAGKRQKNAFGTALHQKFGRHFLKGLSQVPLPMPAQRMLMHRADQALYWLFSKPMERPVLDSDLYRRLADVFRPDVEKLEAFTGKRYDNWLSGS